MNEGHLSKTCVINEKKVLFFTIFLPVIIISTITIIIIVDESILVWILVRLILFNNWRGCCYRVNHQKTNQQSMLFISTNDPKNHEE